MDKGVEKHTDEKENKIFLINKETEWNGCKVIYD
jgi:hypothetical protein